MGHASPNQATDRFVFYADVLGFSAKSRDADASGAVDTLEQLAWLLSGDDPITRHLQRDTWDYRFALSDSLALVAENAHESCAAAIDLYFNLAYVGGGTKPILLRGAISYGEVRITEPIFPETGHANLVGRAVVEAVQLEKSGKGPRLFISQEAALMLAASRSPLTQLIVGDSDTRELAWMLSSNPDTASPGMIAAVIKSIITTLDDHEDAMARPHVNAHIELAIETIRLLQTIDRTAWEAVIKSKDLRALVASMRTNPRLAGYADQIEGI